MVTKTHSHQLRAVFAAVLVIFCASNVSSSGVPRYHKEVLDNGATVVAAHMSDSSLATVQIRVLSGLSNEGEYAGTGISHFMEHMIFRSLQTNGDTPLRKAVKTMGGSINGSTGQDSAEYHITVPKENFRSAMKLLTEMVMKPALDEEGVEMERDVILKEMNMIDDNPSGKQLRLLFERAYRRHVYRYPIIGHKELFLELEKEDLERYHSSVYTPDRIVLGVAGGVLPEEVFRAAGEDLGGFSRAFPWNVSIAEEPKQTVPDIFVTSADVDLGYFAIGFHSVSIYSDDVYPLSIAASILGSGVDSLLYRELVREKQLLHSVNAFNLTPGYPGLFVIQGTCEPENLEEARTEIFKMIECLMSKGVGDDDLERVKNMAVSSYLRSHESTRSVVSSMTSSSILTGGPHFFENYVEKIRGVSPGDVKEAALKYLTVSNSTTAFTVPEEIKEYLEPGRYEDISPEEKVHGIEEMVLDNGLRIIAKRNGSLPLVSVIFAYRGGSMAEEPGLSGIANITASLLLKGTGKRSEKDIVPVIERMGGSISAESGLNSTVVSMTLFPDDLNYGAEILADIIADPVFPDDEIEKQKKLVIAGIRKEEKNIFDIAELGLRKMLYAGHPYSHRTLGEIKVVEDLDRQAIVTFYEETFVPRTSVICVVGDIDPAKTLEDFSDIFSRWEAKGRGVEGKNPLFEQKHARKELTMRKQQSVVAVGFRGVSLYDERKYTLDVISALLSGRDGILFDIVREDAGLAYTSGASNMAHPEEGYFLLYAATTRENLDRAEEKIFSALDTVISGNITDDEIESSRKRSIADHARSLESNSAVAGTMALSELYGLGALHYEEYNEGISKVTRNDIIKAAGEILDPEHAAVLKVRSDL